MHRKHLNVKNNVNSNKFKNLKLYVQLNKLNLDFSSLLLCLKEISLTLTTVRSISFVFRALKI